MTSRIPAAPLAALALLSACGDPVPPPKPRPTPSPNGYIARVKALAPGDLKLTMYRAILKSGGNGCQGVNAVDLLPAAKNGDPLYRATCLDRSLWQIEVVDDGTFLVIGAPSTAN